MARQVAEAVLLWLGIAVLVVCGWGLLSHKVLDRLHYATLGAMVGMPLVLVSQCVATPSSIPKLVVVILLQVAGAPALTIATARAAKRERP